MKNKIIIFSTLILASTAAQAAMTGAQFLKIDTDARLSGMASAGASSELGISALTYNPAGLDSITSPEAAFSHSNWLMDASHDFVGFGLPFKGFGLGIGLTRLSNGSIDGRSDDRSAGSGYSAYDQAVTVGFGFKNLGGAVKYIQSSIDGTRAEAFAVDLGARKALTGFPATIGFGVQNLGTGIKYLSQTDQLPLSVNAGLTVRAFPGVSLGLEVKRLVYDKQTVFSAGAEYALMAGSGMGLALRGGYGLTGITQANSNNGLSVGAGIMALGAQLDYAMTPGTGLGSIQRITLKKKF
jgi:hypothetical protein